MVTSFFAGNITNTEAEGRRELTPHGVPPCLARGEGLGGGIDLYSHGRAVPPGMTYCTVRLPYQGAAQLLAPGNSSCHSCWFITK
jgi:hypothetical protein